MVLHRLNDTIKIRVNSISSLTTHNSTHTSHITPHTSHTRKASRPAQSQPEVDIDFTFYILVVKWMTNMMMKLTPQSNGSY